MPVGLQDLPEMSCLLLERVNASFLWESLLGTYGGTEILVSVTS